MSGEERTCRSCLHSGMDMEMEPYCAHPVVLGDHPHGLRLSGLSAPTRSDGKCTPNHILWELRVAKPNLVGEK